MTQHPATNVQERLRDAYQAVVQTIRPEDIGDLDELRRRRPAVTAARSWRSLLIPLAAAAAVVIAIAAAVTVPHLLRGAATVRPPAPSVSGTSTPPFMLVGVSGPIEVQAEATGKLVGQVPLPPHGLLWAGVAAVGSGRTFLLAAQHLPAGSKCVSSQLYTLFYKVTLSASGKPGPLQPLNVPRVPGMIDGGISDIGSLAVSADGGTIAYTSTPCGATYTSGTTMTIGVIRHGTIRTWTLPWLANPMSLWLSADGSVLGYVDLTEQSPASSLGSAWVLRTDAAPGPAAARGHKVFADAFHGGAQAQGEVLSPDGKTMYLLTAARGNSDQWMTDVLAAYDTTTGALRYKLHTWPRIDSVPPAIAAGGDHLLIWDMFDHFATAQVNLATRTTIMFRKITERHNSPPGSIAW